MSTDRIIRWRLLIEEFGPTFLHIKGEKNVIADALSRLDANFNEKLPTEPTNDTMAYIFMTKADVKETDFPLSPTSGNANLWFIHFNVIFHYIIMW